MGCHCATDKNNVERSNIIDNINININDTDRNRYYVDIKGK